MIILTSVQAALVRGVTTPGNALMPRLLASGGYVLPEAVLSDVAHASRWAALNALPTRTIADGEWAQALPAA